QLRKPEVLAGVALRRRRLVRRRGTTDGRTDVTVAQPQPVAAVARCRPVGVTGAVQGAKQEVAGTITREDAARAVAAVGRRRQANDQDAGARVAEAGHRPAPVVLVAERGPLRPG